LWAASVAWMALLWVLSAQPGTSLESPLPDKILHFAAYAVLGALLYTGSGGGRRGWVIAVAVSSAYGLLDECHQSFVPGRDVALGDLLSDVAGSAVAPLVLMRLLPLIDMRRLFIALCTSAILVMVPLIAFFHQAFPSFTALAMPALMVAVPISGGVWLRTRGTTVRVLLLLGLAAAAVQAAMYALHLTFQEMLHIYEYGLVGALFVWHPPEASSARAPTFLGAVSLTSLVALADESLQWVWPNRVGEIKDIAEDVLFGALGAAVFLLVSRDRPWPAVSRRAVAAAVALAVGISAFYCQVHVARRVTFNGITFLTTWEAGRSWPPRSVGRKEALAHVQQRNRLYGSGRFDEAAAENLILERWYAEFMQGHRYPTARAAALPSPRSPYRSPVPVQLTAF